MDVKKWVLFSSNYFPSITNSIIGKSAIGYFRSKISLVFTNFTILVEVEIPMEDRILVGNLVSILDLVIKILVPIGFISFLVLNPMVKILVTIGSSPFSI